MDFSMWFYFMKIFRIDLEAKGILSGSIVEWRNSVWCWSMQNWSMLGLLRQCDVLVKFFLVKTSTMKLFFGQCGEVLGLDVAAALVCNPNLVVFTIFRLFWNQMNCRLVFQIIEKKNSTRFRGWFVSVETPHYSCVRMRAVRATSELFIYKFNIYI